MYIDIDSETFSPMAELTGILTSDDETVLSEAVSVTEEARPVVPEDEDLVERDTDLNLAPHDVPDMMVDIDSETFSPMAELTGILTSDDETVLSEAVSVTEEARPVVPEDEDLVERDTDLNLAPHDVPDMMVDIVIPSLLIAALFVGNALIVLIIYKYRKRKEGDEVEDEFNTIPLSVNGNVHSAGNAV
uniref:Uncharacterized protein n=1 Tax=Heliothis virescens TaxID=7102 RepID=A0A2A4JWC8_HELVI